LARLENKIVLLSGGASGIGAATARLVLREGGKAVLADRDEARATRWPPSSARTRPS
jgi:NAD(P)-dependent dehydrogenase (short-subunit alcohol dehydrogenase family)